MTIADLDGLVRIVKHKLEKGPAPRDTGWFCRVATSWFDPAEPPAIRPH